MNPLVNEWTAKAEANFNTARRELEVTNAPNYDAVCFHAQQCAEKYLKAKLVDAGVEFGKTHDLGITLNLLVRIVPSWESLREDRMRCQVWLLKCVIPDIVPKPTMPLKL